VATAVLVVHIERLGEESIYRAGVNEEKKVMLDDDFSEIVQRSTQTMRYERGLILTRTHERSRGIPTMLRPSAIR
jgi:hypothetical protein